MYPRHSLLSFDFPSHFFFNIQQKFHDSSYIVGNPAYFLIATMTSVGLVSKRYHLYFYTDFWLLVSSCCIKFSIFSLPFTCYLSGLFPALFCSALHGFNYCTTKMTLSRLYIKQVFFLKNLGTKEKLYKIFSIFDEILPSRLDRFVLKCDHSHTDIWN